MNVGDRIFLPITVQKFPSEKVVYYPSSEEERKFVHSLELYKVQNLYLIFGLPNSLSSCNIPQSKSLHMKGNIPNLCAL